MGSPVRSRFGRFRRLRGIRVLCNYLCCGVTPQDPRKVIHVGVGENEDDMFGVPLTSSEESEAGMVTNEIGDSSVNRHSRMEYLDLETVQVVVVESHQFGKPSESTSNLESLHTHTPIPTSEEGRREEMVTDITNDRESLHPVVCENPTVTTLPFEGTGIPGRATEMATDATLGEGTSTSLSTGLRSTPESHLEDTVGERTIEQGPHPPTLSSDEQPYRYQPPQCPICHQLFATTRNATRHLLLHRRVKAYQCQWCSIVCGGAESLQTHITQAHPDKKPHKCQLSPRTFVEPANLEKHMEIHTDNRARPYKCEQCSRSFLKSWHLKGHLETHNIDRLPHKCHLCSRWFLASTSLRRHLKAHRAAPAAPPSQCQVCSKSFGNPGLLKRHFNRFHTEKGAQQ